MKHSLIVGICAALGLGLASAEGAVLQTQRGAFVEGKVLPPGIGAQVTAHPLSPIKRPVTTQVAADGAYRLEVAPGSYRIVATGPGFAYAGDEPPRARRVEVAYGQTVADVNFDMVPAASISGRVSNAGEGAMVVAMHRSRLPRRHRFTQRDRVSPETGAYEITGLRPGVYDLLIVAPQWGLVDGRGWLLGKPDTLSLRDRKALLEMNGQYEQARRRQDYSAMLRLLSREFADTAGNTYARMAEQAANLDPSKPGAVVLAKYSWQPLLLQGDADSAMAVVSQVTAVRHRHIAVTLGDERTDFLVEYRKENGRWLLYRMDPIRAYRALAGRITRLTGHPCVLPDNYVATYSDDLRLGCIRIQPGETSTGHDYAFGGKRD